MILRRHLNSRQGTTLRVATPIVSEYCSGHRGILRCEYDSNYVIYFGCRRGMMTSVSVHLENLPGQICFRAMKIQDSPRLVEIDALSNKPAWTVKMFERELQLPFSFQVIAHLALHVRPGGSVSEGKDESASPPEDKPVGFGIVWLPFDSAQLIQLAVAPDYRRKGVGRQLMERIIDYARKSNCKKIELEFREGNFPAQKLYEKMGFAVVGKRKNLYPDCDGILMERCFQ